MGTIRRGLENRRRPCQHHRRTAELNHMSRYSLPTSAPPVPALEAEAVVLRVDRASPSPDKITRAEELRLQLADEIVRGALPPGAALDETDIARRFNVSRTPVREALRQLAASGLIDARAPRG